MKQAELSKVIFPKPTAVARVAFRPMRVVKRLVDHLVHFTMATLGSAWGTFAERPSTMLRKGACQGITIGLGADECCPSWVSHWPQASSPSLLTVSLFGLLVSPVLAQENSSEQPQNLQLPPIVGYESTFLAMGTEVQLKAFHRDAEQVAEAFQSAEQRVRELEAILTDYDPSSETRQLSDRAAHQTTVVSDPLWEMLLACDRWYDLSHGAFDASLGQLTQLWRKHRRSTRQPTMDQIDAARATSGWQHVQLDRENHSVHFDLATLRLDFGAIGKGYIVDQVHDVLLSHEVPCSLINISGNMRAGIAPPERVGWRIEIAPLEPGGRALRQVHLASQAIATSGDLWQFTVVDGVRRSHILDPKTGIGVPGPRCATVIAPTAADADALATTACIVGFDAAAQIAKQLIETELLCADLIAEDAHGSREPVHEQSTPGFPTDISDKGKDGENR